MRQAFSKRGANRWEFSGNTVVQLGTAQVIAFLRHFLISIITQGLTEEEEWREAVDAAYWPCVKEDTL